MEWWQNSPCPQLVLDADAATVERANDTFWAWSGLREEDILGTSFARLLPVGDRILWSTHCLPKLESSGRVSEVSLQVIGAGGVRRAAFLTASRLPAAAPPPVPGLVETVDGDEAHPEAGQVLVALFGAAERRRYEEDLLETTRRAEASEARRAQAEAGLQHLAHHDPVTGLLNRRGLQVALLGLLTGNATAGATGHHPDTDEVVTSLGCPVVFFIDLDGFKAVNDAIGHAGGDTLLNTVAERLRTSVRAQALLARFAGDEFVIADHLATRDDIDALCQRLLAALAEPVVIAGVEVVVSASIGVARCADDPTGRLGETATRAESLLHRADAAMYQVKHGSRAGGAGGWAVHDPGAPDPAADRLRLLEQLRHAVTNGQLRLHYQPRIDLSDGSTSGVEALVRWAHPERGLLSPAHFIEAAESSGLIRELGAWVIDAAVAQTAAWNAAGRRLQVGVNVSARQLSDPALVGVVTAALARHGVPASQLVIEITETALMVDPEAAAANLQQLTDLGTLVAVDDFGTGYASLTYLRRFPVHELKIDQSFVAGVVVSPRDRAIVAGCIQLAHALGLVSVAEGVETSAQRDVLIDLGCQVVQGYFYGRPQSPDSLQP
ncbi:bifunctional diguanylate cyclase/phosphodiesterase [Quadrisphaera sp. INWT6]|uniref:putative bifunctional diguanylate cyclase/phosphodiesterase n=1 Tax=Quadrisphaera sp. INWT6 TaxID=2596917 RepID=UPI00189224C8|nr:bifunctional diguanylate cyclase/phosphodiesterase [Quadrisphaera sp. INWT6]MBF5081969.1 bifunctional diguanylate cyclase/phosphodiesterase [Quadrisphaera sp. INWT6]